MGKKLSQLIREGYQEKNDLSCSETILYGANQVYHLGLDEQDLKLAAGFGGGMGIESVCGALTGSIMVLGRILVDDKAHENDSEIYDVVAEFLGLYRQKMGSINCAPLKDKHYNQQSENDSGCREIILTAAQLLEEFIAEKQEKTNL